jgi:hypothetical protein
LIGERTDGAEIETDGDRWAIGRLIPPEAKGAKGEIKKNIERVNIKKAGKKGREEWYKERQVQGGERKYWEGKGRRKSYSRERKNRMRLGDWMARREDRSRDMERGEE